MSSITIFEVQIYGGIGEESESHAGPVVLQAVDKWRVSESVADIPVHSVIQTEQLNTPLSIPRHALNANMGDVSSRGVGDADIKIGLRDREDDLENVGQTSVH